MSGEAPLPDSDLGFHKFCQKSSRVGKNKIFRWEKEICFGRDVRFSLQGEMGI
jgi:hypothetical protein